MDNYNWLANYVPRPQMQQPQSQGDTISRLGRGLQLGRAIGNIPYENAMQADKMAEIERLKAARNAMSEYGTTGDITPLMGVAPEKAFERKDTEALIEIKKLGVVDDQIKAGVTAITSLAPLVTEQNYPQFRQTVGRIFANDEIMPKKYDPELLNQVVQFANRTKNGGLMNMAPGAVAFDPATQKEVYRNPRTATPMSPEAIDLKQRELDIKDRGNKTIVPGEDGQPDRVYSGKVAFPRGGRGGEKGNLAQLEASFKRLNPGKPVTPEALADFKNIFDSGIAKRRNPVEVAASLAKHYDGKSEDFNKWLQDTTVLIADMQGQYSGRKGTTPGTSKKAVGKTPDGRTVYEGADGKKFTTE